MAPPFQRDLFFSAARDAANRGKGAAFLQKNAQVIDQQLSTNDRLQLNSIVSPTLGQTERQDIAVSDVQKQQHEPLALRLISTPATWGGQIAESVASSPVALAKAAPTIGRAAYHALRGGVTPAGQAREQAKPEAQKARDALNELGRQQYKSVLSDIHDPIGRGGFLALDVAALANPSFKAYLKLRGIPLPKTERALTVERGAVQPQASPATLTRALQHAADRAAEKHPNVPIVGAKSRVARAIPGELEREHGRKVAEVAPLARTLPAPAGKVRRLGGGPGRLSRSEDIAAGQIRRYGKSKAAAMTDQEIATVEQRIKNARDLTEKKNQEAQLVKLKAARKHVQQPSEKVLGAHEAGRELAGKSQQTKVDIGQLTPEGAAVHLHEAAAVHIPGPAWRGLLAEKRVLEGLQESPGVVRERARVERLQKRHEKTLAGMRNPKTGELKFTGAQRKRVGQIHQPDDSAIALRTALRPMEKELRRLKALHDAPAADLIAQRASMNRLLRTGNVASKAVDKFAEAAGTKPGVQGLDELKAQIAAMDEQVKQARGLEPEHLTNLRKNVAQIRRQIRKLEKPRSIVMEGPKPYVARAKGGVEDPIGAARAERVGSALSVAKDRLEAAEQTAAAKAGFTKTKLVRDKRTGVQKREQVGDVQAYRKALAGRDTRLEQIRQHQIHAGRQLAREGAYYGPSVPNEPVVRNLAGRAQRSVTGKQAPLVRRTRHILAEQGRERTGLRTTLEDYLKTSRYTSHLEATKRAREFSKPLNPEVPGGLDKGHRYFNPEGHKIPRSFKEDMSAADMEGLSPKELADGLQGDYEALIKNTFPDEASMRNLSPKMQAKVRQVDERIARAFEGGRYRPPSHGAVKVLGQVLDVNNDVSKAALVYLSGHYIPVNLASNLALGAFKQHVFLPWNFAKTLEVMGHFSPETLQYIKQEVNQGAARALASSRGAPTSRAVHGLANVMGKLADEKPRMAAFVHEAAQKGYKTEAQMRELLTNKAKRSELNQISGQANNDMVDFHGMSQGARDTIARAAFLYPWVRGALKWTARLPLDYPGRSAVLAHLGDQERQNVERKLGQLVSYLRDLTPVGPAQKKLGSIIQPVINPSTITPGGVLRDVLGTVDRTLTGQGSGKRLIQYANPVIKGGFEAASGLNTFTGRPYPANMSGPQIFGQSVYGNAPLVTLAKGLASKKQTEPFTGPPEQQPNFVPGGPGEAVGRFFLGGFQKRDLNVSAAQAKGQRERDANIPAPEREFQHGLEKARQQAQHFKVEGGLPKEVVQDLRWRRDLDTALSQINKGHPAPEEKAKTAATLFVRRFPEAKKDVADALAQMRTEDDWKQLYRDLRSEATGNLHDWNVELNAAERDERAAAAR